MLRWHRRTTAQRLRLSGRPLPSVLAVRHRWRHGGGGAGGWRCHSLLGRAAVARSAALAGPARPRPISHQLLVLFDGFIFDVFFLLQLDFFAPSASYEEKKGSHNQSRGKSCGKEEQCKK